MHQEQQDRVKGFKEGRDFTACQGPNQKSIFYQGINDLTYQIFIQVSCIIYHVISGIGIILLTLVCKSWPSLAECLHVSWFIANFQIAKYNCVKEKVCTAGVSEKLLDPFGRARADEQIVLQGDFYFVTSRITSSQASKLR